MYLDYFSALVDDRGMLKRALTKDGLHPTDVGYKIMVPLAEKAIQKALAENRAPNPLLGTKALRSHVCPAAVSFATSDCGYTS